MQKIEYQQINECSHIAQICHSLQVANKSIQKYLKPEFDNRCVQAVNLILKSHIEFIELGLFGSYARGTYKGTSDIDICVVTPKHPDRSVSGRLRQDLEDIGVDLLYVTPETFMTSDRPIYRNIRKEYVRLL